MDDILFMPMGAGATGLLTLAVWLIAAKGSHGRSRAFGCALLGGGLVAMAGMVALVITMGHDFGPSIWQEPRDIWYAGYIFMLLILAALLLVGLIICVRGMLLAVRIIRKKT